jgi:uncharacterized membrane protein
MNSSVLPQNLQQLKLASLVCYYGLMFSFLISTFFVFDEFRLSSAFIWLLQILPLLIFARGLHQGRLRSYAWMSFVVLLYFIQGVLTAYDAERMWLGLLSVFFCVFLFLFLILYIRQYRNHYQVPL